MSVIYSKLFSLQFVFTSLKTIPTNPFSLCEIARVFEQCRMKIAAVNSAVIGQNNLTKKSPVWNCIKAGPPGAGIADRTHACALKLVPWNVRNLVFLYLPSINRLMDILCGGCPHERSGSSRWYRVLSLLVCLQLSCCDELIVVETMQNESIRLLLGYESLVHIHLCVKYEWSKEIYNFYFALNIIKLANY